MAQRMIAAGYDMVLWARRAETLAPYADTGASIADSVSALGAQVQYCAICVVDDAGVQQVFDELLATMKAGGIIVIHSTVHPDLCKKLAIAAAEKHIALVDAPVSGGGSGAADGTLTVMLGGKADVVEKVTPILKTFAGLITHLGDVGSGQLAKLVNNSLMAANLALANHALSLAQTLGIEKDAFSELVKVSSGRSFAFDVCSRLSQPQDFQHGAKLLAKDVRLLGEALEAVTLEVDTPEDEVDYDAIRKTAGAFLDKVLD